MLLAFTTIWGACADESSYDDKPCGDVTEDGTCTNGHYLVCNDGELVDHDCVAEGWTRCGTLTDGRAFCTNDCPSDATTAGICNGSHLTKCDGTVYVDLDCDSGQICGPDVYGTAWCGPPCPAGSDVFGTCDGNSLSWCNGTFLSESACESYQSCDPQFSRHGVDCRGCGDITPEGRCNDDGTLEFCTTSNGIRRSSCPAQGATCGWDAVACRHACLGAQSQDTCAAEGLSEGQSKCVTNEYRKFVSIVSCNQGIATEVECPAATDGSVTCSDTGGVATCSVDCGATGKRCTDRGVLVTCSSPTDWTWFDCTTLGATCVEGNDPHCACTSLSVASQRCHSGYQYACENGRIVDKPCTCPADPSGNGVDQMDCSETNPCPGSGVCVTYANKRFCSTWCSTADPSSCPSDMVCTADPGASKGVCVPK